MTWERLMSFIKAEDIRLRERYGVKAPGSQWYTTHFVKLTEEVGELAEQVLAHQSLQRPEKGVATDDNALGDEVADVLIATLLVAGDMGVDVASALEHKIAKIEARYK